jgi:CubicO group peptidase (beta-lactamase class C family)
MPFRHTNFLIASLLPLMAEGNSVDTPGRVPIPESARTTFAKAFHRLCTEDKVVGASALVVDGDQDAVFETFGFQDLDSGTPVSRDTTFHWASITKTLTSIGILQLRDRGLLRLQDPITRYAPELRRVHNPFGSIDTITLQHLLTHTAGFRNGTWPWKKGEPWEPFEPTRWEQLVAMFPYMSIGWRPGEKYGYSNPGYIYLARVIEEISGDPFVSEIDKNMLRPLGMTGAYFDRSPYHLLARRSHSYHLSREGKDLESPFNFHTGITTGNGGLNASVPDMGIYLHFLLGTLPRSKTGAGATLTEPLVRSTLDELMRPLVQTDPAQTRCWRGLGFFIDKESSRTLIHHSGDQNSFRSLLIFDLERRQGIVFVQNSVADEPSPAEPNPMRLRDQMRGLFEDLTAKTGRNGP